MYNNLTLIQKGNNHYIDSREVAELIGKRHDHLLRDIDKYCATMAKSTAPKIGVSDFFLENSYFDSTGRKLPCYLLSKMGCEMVANKLTGEKGILFTAAYVAKFNTMETHLRAEWEKQQTLLPTLSDCNATAKIVIDQLKRTGVTTYRILDFLDELYEPLGISVLEADEFADIPQTYTPLQIAYLCGVYSIYGNPHAHAISCILNDHLHIAGEHKFPTIPEFLYGIQTSFRYDEHALNAVKDWLSEHRYPSGVQSYGRTYHVVYRKNKTALATAEQLTL